MYMCTHTHLPAQRCPNPRTHTTYTNMTHICIHTHPHKHTYLHRRGHDRQIWRGSKPLALIISRGNHITGHTAGCSHTVPARSLSLVIIHSGRHHPGFIGPGVRAPVHETTIVPVGRGGILSLDPREILSAGSRSHRLHVRSNSVGTFHRALLV